MSTSDTAFAGVDGGDNSPCDRLDTSHIKECHSSPDSSSEAELPPEGHDADKPKDGDE